MQQKANIVIMAGGTGGHVFPALALADALSAVGHKITWLGTQAGIESRVVREAGYDIDYIPISGLRGKGALAWLALPFRLGKAIIAARKIIKRRQAGLVIGMGGFATGPGGIASKLLNIPLVLHEQNAIPGMTNRYLAKIAKKILCAFPATFPDKYQPLVTGNPVRQSIVDLWLQPYNLPPDRPLRLLVLGGSLGAKVLNEIVPAAIAAIPPAERPEVMHQAGEKTVALAKNEYARQQVSAQVETFIKDMAQAYAWADIVVCRAGALTVSELALAKRPAILVPYLHAVDDHQHRNAQYLTQAGAAVCILQNELNAEKLATTLRSWHTHREHLVAMSQKTGMLAKPQATQAALQECLSLL